MNDQTQATQEDFKPTRIPKTERWITGNDGVSRDFGARAKVVTQIKTSEAENKLDLTFAFENGEVLNFSYSPEASVSNFELQVLAEGFVSKAKGSIAGVNTSEQLVKVIAEKIKQFTNKFWATRQQGGSIKPKEVSLNKMETVYGRLQGYSVEDLQSSEVIKAVKEDFAALTPEALKELKTTKAFIRMNAIVTSEIALATVEQLDAE